MSVLLIVICIVIIGNNWSYTFIYSNGTNELDEPEITSKTVVDLKDLKPKGNTSLDTVVDYIRCNQIHVIDRQAELVNDFRQEMNNNINKMNTWLAFAIGVMSIVGVFIPLFMQYRIQNDEKENNKKLQSEINTKLKTCHTSVHEKIAEMNGLMKSKSEKVASIIHSLELSDKERSNSLEKLRKEYLHELDLQKLSTCFFSFIQGMECNVIRNQPDRDLIMRFTWTKVVDSFHKVVAECTDESELSELDRSHLMISLIMMYAVVDRMKSVETSRSIRECDQITDLIRPILSKLEAGFNNATAWQEIRNNISDLMQKIQSLHEIF